MFTGIVEETGYVKSFKKQSDGALLTVGCRKILDGTKTGDSICTNGVCLTVSEIFKDGFSAMLSNETLEVSDFSDVKPNDKLNLERALRLQDRLGGHIVSGHIDCLGKIVSINKMSDFYDIETEIPHEMSKYVVYKGSIALDGISLTVADVKDNIFRVSIIPHTFNNTVLKDLSKGDAVNIETDILSKYVEKLLLFRDNKSEKSNISLEFLKENGFV